MIEPHRPTCYQTNSWCASCMSVWVDYCQRLNYPTESWMCFSSQTGGQECQYYLEYTHSTHGVVTSWSCEKENLWHVSTWQLLFAVHQILQVRLGCICSLWAVDFEGYPVAGTAYGSPAACPTSKASVGGPLKSVS